MSKIYIVSAKQGEGKTGKCKEIAQQLQAKGLNIGGFLSPGTWENGERDTFQIVDLQSQKSYDFASRKPKDQWDFIRPFYFNPKTIRLGEELLRNHSQKCDILFVDEIGKFDIKGKLWGPVLHELVNKDISLILSVREGFVQDVVSCFHIKDYQIIGLEDQFVI
ncbi:MAG: hypothetical protein B7C24_05315 [Bacteroidetes bacterium 4572_77]|nr:MAG: hypothetical protein B7C24_05315 [Bacteroidetes bacterium 4572_77]